MVSRNASLEMSIARAAEALRSADALLVGAGAGMGVDSGLPDFRGPEGFWRAYPRFRGRAFSDVSNPRTFLFSPALAWGFFGHRLGLYRSTAPHAGFAILRRWAERIPLGAFVFTSNVDGQFQRAGFAPDRVFECHGSIHHLQCTRPCGRQIWSADDLELEIDETTFEVRSNLPTCPRCGGLARPNILMFGDDKWIPDRHDEQRRRYLAWLRKAKERNIVAVELGAGRAISTVRHECEMVSRFVIRVNPRDCEPPTNGVALPIGAAEALAKIDEALSKVGGDRLPG